MSSASIATPLPANGSSTHPSESLAPRYVQPPEKNTFRSVASPINLSMEELNGSLDPSSPLEPSTVEADEDTLNDDLGSSSTEFHSAAIVPHEPNPMKALHTPNTSDLDALERAESTPNLISSPETLMGPRFSLRRTSGRRPLSILSSSSMNSDLSHCLDPLLESLPLKNTVPTHAHLDQSDPSLKTSRQSRHQRHRSMLGSSLDRITQSQNPQGVPSQHSTPGHFSAPFDQQYEYCSSGANCPSGVNCALGANCHLGGGGSQYIYRDQYPHYGLPPADFFGIDPYTVPLEERRSSTCLTPFLEPFHQPIDTEPLNDTNNFAHNPANMTGFVGNGSPHYSRPPQLALRTRSCPNGLPGLAPDPFFAEFADPKFASPISPLCTTGKNSYEQIEAANETMQDMLVRLAAKERQVLEAKQRWESLCGELEVYRQHCNTNLVPNTGRVILPIKPSIIARRHHPNIGLNSLHYTVEVRTHWNLEPLPVHDTVARQVLSAKFNRAFNMHARRYPLSVKESPQVLVWRIDSEVPAPSQSENMDTLGEPTNSKTAMAHRRGGIAYYIVKCLLGVVHCVITTFPVHQREFSFQNDLHQLIPEYPMPMSVLFGHLNHEHNGDL